MDTVSCQLEISEVKGMDANRITVGQHLFLKCDGIWDQSFEFNKAQIKTSEEQKYTIKVLQAGANKKSGFDLDFVLYSAGDYQFQEFIITDGVREINLGPQKFQVASVITPPEDGKPPEPYGSVLPLSLTWPTYYFISFLILLALLLLALILKLRRRARYKKLIDGLKKYNSTVSPDLQIYKSIRVAEKSNYPIADLEKHFRLYVLRVFQVPMFDLNNKQIVRFFKKRKAMHKKERLSVQKFLDEFEELHKKNDSLSTAERLEFVNKIYRFVDQTSQIRGST